jgi:hypothetical protein
MRPVEASRYGMLASRAGAHGDRDATSHGGTTATRAADVPPVDRALEAGGVGKRERQHQEAAAAVNPASKATARSES